MKRTILVVLATMLCSLWNRGECQEVNVIPYPQQVMVNKSACKVKKLKKIVVNTDKANIEGAALLLKEKMAEMGYDFTITGQTSGKGSISLSIVAGMANEGYKLEVKKQQVEIQASTYAGIVYGIQTLLQEARSGAVRCGTISDAPRYAWRGYMLDESRHFQGIDKVKQVLDLMSYYKLNRFHWHLTDEQGWRIEIKAYPKLTTVGGIGCNSNPKAPATFYTQDQIREIVKYAKQRAIEIVPEIDMPGHAGAANRAYPEFQAMGTEKYPDYCFNPGKEGTYTYLTNILKEVAELFPAPYIHIGGDEVSYGNLNWTKDPDIITLMQQQGLKTAQEVEGYFLQRMAGVVHSLGKVMLGWDDVIADGIKPQGTILTWWRHDKTTKITNILKDGYPTVLCPRLPLYLDFVQNESHNVGRKWFGKDFCRLQDVYAFPESTFAPLNLDEGNKKNVVGIQGNLWGELTQNPERLDFMTWPRLIAISESGWTQPQNKSFESFEKRLDVNYDYLKSLNIYYYDHRNPSTHPEPAGPVFVSSSTQGV